jgi:PRKCA-binding protein
LIKKLDELERTGELYRGLMEHTKVLLKSIFELSTTHKAFGDLFSSIASREQQKRASEAFSKFGEAHRQIDKFAHALLKTIKPVSMISFY